MLDITGGDAAALTEITDAQDMMLRLRVYDLPILAQLNVHRSRLADRNAHLPASLPAIWATIGYLDRAEALTRSVIDPGWQAQALTDLAGVVAGAGDLDRAGALAGQAEAAARSITDPDRQAQALTDLARVVAGAGDLDRAEAMAGRPSSSPVDHRPGPAGTGTDRPGPGGGGRRDLDRAEAGPVDHQPGPAVLALAALAGVVAGAGDLDRAEALARSISDPDRQVRALADLAGVVAGAGDLDRAEAAGPVN